MSDLHIVVTYGVNISAIGAKHYPQGSLHSGGRYRYGGGEGQRVCGRYAGGIASRFGGVLEAALFRQRLREVIRK